MALQLLRLPLISSSSSSCSVHTHLILDQTHKRKCVLCSGGRLNSNLNLYYSRASKTRKSEGLFVGKEDVEMQVQDEEYEVQDNDDGDNDYDDDEARPPSPEDLQYIQEIKTVLDLLKKNRDMLFNEVKLTIMIEDPRDVERRRLLGIEDSDAPTREDLAEALEQVNEGKVPKNRAALKMLAEEMLSWPNLEVEAPKTKPKKSMYAKATDTGIDPQEAAKRLNIDWDSAAEIENANDTDEAEVPPAVLGVGK